MSASDTFGGAVRRDRPPEPGPLRPYHFPAFERFSLANGVPVLHAHVPDLPVVSLSVLVRAGGVHEPAERAGLASLTAALLESGAAGRSAGEIADLIELLGVQLSTGTSWDVSHVDVTAISSRIEPAAQIMAELVTEPTFPEDEFERIRDENLAAILQRRAEPRGLANEMAARFIFSDATPFARPLGGTSASLAALSRADAAAFHSGRFTPLAASVVVAGDLTRTAAEELLNRCLGGWAGPRPEPVVVRVEPRSTTREVVIVNRPGSVQSEIRVGQVGVSRSSPDYFPIVVMNTILGGAFTSRLNLNLRERQGFTYGVSSAFSMRRNPGPFAVSTAVQTEVTASALGEIFNELAGIRTAEVSDAELEDARNYVAGVFPLGLQTTSGIASRLAEIAIFELDDDYFDHYRSEVLAVTREQVQQAANAHLDPEAMVAVVVGDAAKIQPEIEALALGPVRVVDPKEVP